MKKILIILGIVSLFLIAGCETPGSIQKDIKECSLMLDLVKLGNSGCDAGIPIECSDFRVTDKEVILSFKNIVNDKINAIIYVEGCEATDNIEFDIGETKTLTITCFNNNEIVFKDITIDYTRQGKDYITSGIIYAVVER